MTHGELDLTITGIAHGGLGVARDDGRVVFVSDAIPGERVRAQVTDDSKDRFWRAATVEVLESSPHRREHVWREASLERSPARRVGGAEFGAIDLPHQRTLKAEVLADAMTRFGKLATAPETEVQAVPGETDGLGYRTRVSLRADHLGRLGQRAARSHDVVAVQSLPLATDAVQAGAPLDQTFEPGQRVDVLAPAGSAARLVIGEQKPSVVTERVGDRDFSVDDTGFWQVHRGAAELLSREVAAAARATGFDPEAANLDLYGGVGLFAAALGDEFGAGTRIVSVESDERATDHAGANLADWVGARAETGRVDRWLAGYVPTAKGDGATVVLDPPRAGAGAAVCRSLIELAPSTIIYVACDPVALARDTATLTQGGYTLSSLSAWDLFPQTHHFECIATFIRNG